MVSFFKQSNLVIAVNSSKNLDTETISKLEWLFSGAKKVESSTIEGTFVGPRKEMITPWSTNAVEITENMGIEGILRIEEFFLSENENPTFDPMLQRVYKDLSSDVYTIDTKKCDIVEIEDINTYNKAEGLALNPSEVEYLNNLSQKLGRKLTDSEVFGFSQVNSEHCRHKIFNGEFIIDGEVKESSLFKMIRKTTNENPNFVKSAYKDNVAFIDGPKVVQFAPEKADVPSEFEIKDIKTVISLKAETHNFPTTVEPFNGAATGSGGEIRDRMGGGKASIPMAGSAVYMTSYPRNKENATSKENAVWTDKMAEREWLYQTPEEILIKASNGASDFGNKFGQPLINGSLLTFEHEENGKKMGYDKVIMLAGGVGYAKEVDAIKDVPQKGDKVVVMGGDNYRIGMGGGAVSSVATGEFSSGIELNAVQRSNPEMQKRAFNAIRALSESDENPIVSIHDHGAGGHLNCLSELVEETGGKIIVENLPIGDPTLSSKEVVGNESQERMGFVVKEEAIEKINRIAQRERAPMYVVGEATGDDQFTFEQKDGKKVIDLQIKDMLGNPPKTILKDTTIVETFNDCEYDANKINEYVESVLAIEAVACKDWLTNKVDRSVTGKIAKQQNAGELHLPLNNLGAVALDYVGVKGIANSIGHASVPAIIDAKKGSVLSIAESLTNIIWAPMTHGIKGVSLSANWMWPANNSGENARLYSAVEAVSDFACSLGVNIPTGKDSLSMTQKYKNGDVVYSPGTVIISAVGEVEDITKIVEPVVSCKGGKLLLVDMSQSEFALGGSSFFQTLGKLGKEVPTVKDGKYFVNAFETVQKLIKADLIEAGHDISAGGLITTLLEMLFSNTKNGMNINLSTITEKDIVKVLFSERPSIVVQVCDENLSKVEAELKANSVEFNVIGNVTEERVLNVNNLTFDIDTLRDKWFETSYLLDRKQSGVKLAKERFANYKNLPLTYKFPNHFNGKMSSYGIELKRLAKTGVKGAIIREKGVNGDREMAYSMYLAGFDVKDVHMTDLINGRETLEDVNLIVFTGGFSNSDVLGSAKGWAGAFLYNPKAKEALEKFYARKDTLSLGVCNGCQLMVELGVIYPEHKDRVKMLHNDSHKFESTFLTVEIPETNSVMLNSLVGSKLGVWVAHGEGKFSTPYEEDKYNIALKYSSDKYPANPNGSMYNTAGLCSVDGRHLAMMPHLERAILPWQWAKYDKQNGDEVTPWIEAFVNAREWVVNNRTK